MGAEKQQEATISKVDSGISGHESSVRAVMGWGGHLESLLFPQRRTSLAFQGTSSQEHPHCCGHVAGEMISG